MDAYWHILQSVLRNLTFLFLGWMFIIERVCRWNPSPTLVEHSGDLWRTSEHPPAVLHHTIAPSPHSRMTTNINYRQPSKRKQTTKNCESRFFSNSAKDATSCSCKNNTSNNFETVLAALDKLFPTVTKWLTRCQQVLMKLCQAGQNILKLSPSFEQPLFKVRRAGSCQWRFLERPQQAQKVFSLSARVTSFKSQQQEGQIQWKGLTDISDLDRIKKMPFNCQNLANV